jgi:predicted nuclease of predicted toxin-antitoxin system
VKFLLDMGISPHLIPDLHSDGHEAAHIADLSTGTLPDAEILSRARVENQVLLVHDLDFPVLMAASGSRSPSVIVFRLRNMRPENVLAYLRRALVKSREALEQGAIVSVTEGAVRVRLLPIRDSPGEEAL